ncbi:MAG: enoyl-CoA hydratase [Amycolatopsis sp.]|jgi:enoyl-CoA hydratase|uniref:enoyl-CoA hydratase n=1 Tax=Amycolatopsis sp. TaxID=37632 RepID=UPI002639D390|nr:enoyl-CoA hydratase [Amycolatopsis sp.]MCU1683903.1 enoyl-CoA hydratase [Amycolatopsis sp.]MDT5188452.1 enoyl-CoA hydratase [Mycobacterium sp.]
MSNSTSTIDPVLLIEQRGSVRILTFNRPKSRNALNPALIGRLRTELAAADADEKTDAVILTGSDPAFCAGVDLREFANIGDDVKTSDDGVPTGHPWRPLAKPVIGAINGAAVTGGLELALACDFLIASDRARFADTHARVGLVPRWGLTSRLPAAVGRGFARRMSLSGDFVTAAEALRVGLVTQVVEHETLLAATVEAVLSIVGNDQPGVRTLLSSYRRAEEHMVDPALQVEDETAQNWMKDFEPSRVADRRAEVVSRGRMQNAVSSSHGSAEAPLPQSHRAGPSPS